LQVAHEVDEVEQVLHLVVSHATHAVESELGNVPGAHSYWHVKVLGSAIDGWGHVVTHYPRLRYVPELHERQS
jgi:hypothetical protein